MAEIIKDSFIVLKEYINEKEYKELNELSRICERKDKINLKLELDYKLNISGEAERHNNLVNEFLYYINDKLVSYIGISCFGGNTAELNGITHPEYRRKGLFKKIFQLAINECRVRNYREVLLLSDDASCDGVDFIKANGGKYKCSEYSMKYDKDDKVILNEDNDILLEKADRSDSNEIKKQDSIYWGEELDGEECEIPSNTEVYMIKKSDKTVGKIHVEYSDNYAYIFGFGIKPEYRCNGFGRSALEETVNLILGKNIEDIRLDVACENKTALNLYKKCGFKENSVMNYYKIM
ncbi:MAG: GNAT family N-acetyltransferase [Clostridium sp.]|nr:GNAT family N-acetyltransferase [Clostridium sp.]